MLHHNRRARNRTRKKLLQRNEISRSRVEEDRAVNGVLAECVRDESRGRSGGELRRAQFSGHNAHGFCNSLVEGEVCGVENYGILRRFER